MKKNLRTITAVLGPAIVLSFLFSVKLNAASGIPAQKVEKKLSYIQAMKKGIQLSVSEK